MHEAFLYQEIRTMDSGPLEYVSGGLRGFLFRWDRQGNSGFFCSEQVATLERNKWLLWSGLGGYFALEYANNFRNIRTPKGFNI
jgi:hypothetical protein